MAATDFTKRLKAADKLWKTAKQKAAEKSGPPEFEDGKYVTRIVDAVLCESESSGRLQVRFDHKFEEGQYEGQTKFDYQGLETEQNQVFFARIVGQLGYEAPESLTEITDILEDIKKTKPLCKVTLKTKGDFQNVYINKVFMESSDEEEEEESADVENDADEQEEEEVAEEGGDEEEGDGGDESEEDAEEEETVEEDEEAEEETVELNVGMTVIANLSAGPKKGEVIEILDTEGKARVRLADGKVVRVALDKIEVDQTVPEEPKAAKKKAAPAPAPAPAPAKKKPVKK